MPNKESETINLKRIKVDGYIMIPESNSKDEFSKKFNKFLKDNNFHLIGGINEQISTIRLNKSDPRDDLINIWNNVIKIIGGELSEVTFNTWIKPITPYSIDRDKLILIVENDFLKGILVGRYLNLIQSAVILTTNKSYKIEIYAKDEVEGS